MKNNSLHITYHSDLTMQKTVERVRCTSVAGAQEIMSKKNPGSIKKAIFIGPQGGVYPIKH